MTAAPRSTLLSRLTALALLLFPGAALSFAGEPQVTVLEPTPGATLVRVTLDSFESTPVRIAGATWLELSVAGEGTSDEVGAPRLPRVSRSVVIPDRQDVSVRVVGARYHDVPDISVAPARGPIPRTQDPASVPYTFGPAYTQDAWYPSQLVVAREPYVMRDVRGAVIDVHALQYNPRTRMLRVYDEVVFRVETAGAAAANALDRAGAPDRGDVTFAGIFAEHFVNYAPPEVIPFNESGELLIISHGPFMAAMQPFVDWKNSRGIRTTIVDVASIGNNTTAIKSYVQGRYNATNLSYLLLVGDLAEVTSPMFLGGASDPSYSTLTPDWYPEILVGRFSAQSVAHVATQVTRSIEYEQMDHSLAAGGWNAQGMGIASDQGPGHFGEYDFQHMNLIRQDMLGLGFTLVDQVYDPTATRAMIANGLNAGRRMVNYCGHGSQTSWGTTGYSNGDVAALVNDNRLPFISSVACVNGDFSGTCFGEAWLRATHNGEPTGAVGAYMSSINQYWNEPMYAQDESVDRFCAQSYWSLAGLWFAGSCTMMDVAGSAGHDMFMTWICFGDPSLRVLGTQSPPTNAYCNAKPTSLGKVPSINSYGTPNLTANDFHLTCDLAVPNKVGLHIRGTAAQSAPFYGGTLCVQTPLTRGPAGNFDAFGTRVEPLAFAAVDVGRTYYYQYWGRDVNHPDGTGVLLSNALQVSVGP